MATRIVGRITHREDSYIPFWCKVYVVEHRGSYYLYITSRIHKTRLRKSGVSYSYQYMQSKDITQDSHYINLVTPFK